MIGDIAKAKSGIFIVLIIVVIIVLLSLAKKLGLLSSKSKVVRAEEEKQVKQLTEINRKLQDIKTEVAFDPNFHRRYDFSTYLRVEKAKEIAEKIKDSFGFFNDDEEEIYSQLRRLPNKRHVSQVASYYDGDLLGDILDSFNNSEKLIVFDIVDSKNE